MRVCGSRSIDRDVPSYFQSLEHLLRYCARPPFALERLSVIRDADSRIARIRYVMPRHKAANWVGPGRKRGRSFPSSARRAAATSGSEETAGVTRRAACDRHPLAVSLASSAG